MFDHDPQDDVFQALASEQRRRILDLVKARPGMNLRSLCSHFEISRIGVMKHLEVLERADLVISERVGRERRLYFNVMPIHAIYERWTNEYSALWARRLADLKERVESGLEAGASASLTRAPTGVTKSADRPSNDQENDR